MSAQRLDRAVVVRLLDGAQVCVRRLDKGDIDAVIELHKHLSDREQYLRFFVVHPAYLEKFAEKLAQRDPRHCALGAFDSGRLIGVANYVVADKPDVAEVAVAVAHREHLRGVATVLLHRLGIIALRNGIHTFTADVLPDNTAMLKLLSDAGWTYTTRLEESVLSIRIDLSRFDDPAAEASSTDR
jgi:RimJ/RimL family protein N-acetyltransferase